MALTLTESKAQQAHENGKVVTAARLHDKGLLDQDFQEFFQGRLDVRLGLPALQLAIEAEAERPEEPREYRLDQGLFFEPK
nr:hypothetical protein GCM10020185_05770 [Pseudomonas brassicacearum subsp. brassicacearum]